jgi:hypothetical protein
MGWTQKDSMATVLSRDFYLVLRVDFASPLKQLSDGLVLLLVLTRMEGRP